MKFNELLLRSIGHTVQMSGMVFSGEGKMFVCLFPDDGGTIATDRPIPVSFYPNDGTQELEVCTLDMNHDEWQQFIRQTDILETEVLTQASDGTLAKVILRKSQRQIETGIQWRVFKRAGYCCEYCGRDDVPLTVDHVICWENGGISEEINLLAACRKCNKVRGNLPYEDWLRHPRYLEQSRKLSPEVRAANEARVATLASIPRFQKPRSR